MNQIVKLGETSHDKTFFVDRPNGYPYFLLLLVKTPARFYFDGKLNDVEENTVFLFKPEQKHLYYPAKNCDENKAYTDIWIHIKSENIKMPDNFEFGKPVKIHQMEKYDSLFAVMSSTFYGNSLHKNQILDQLVSVLLSMILDESDVFSYPENYYRFVELRRKIYSDCSEQWTVTKMAENLNLSEGYVQDLYKKYFGVSCIKDVISARIQNACEYLSGTNYSIEKIAEICGYNNTEHFIRQFKDEKGKTPFQWKKSGQNL